MEEAKGHRREAEEKRKEREESREEIRSKSLSKKTIYLMRKTTFFHTFLKRKEKKPFRYTFPNLVSFFRLHRQTRQFNNNFHRCLQRYEKKFEEIFHQEKGNEMYKEGKHRVWKLLR